MSQQEESIDSGAKARIQAVLEEFLRQREAGDAPSDETLKRAHPDLMPELEYGLRKLRISDVRRELPTEATAVAKETHTGRSAITGVGQLRVRCPNCHEPMDLAVDTPLTSLSCRVCGADFSIIDESRTTWTVPALSTLGRFELVGRIGVGGFGVVWKARDRQLDRLVAIKIPRRGDLNSAEVENFLREARAAAQLRHPGIVSVHEIGRDGESVFIVSDFVRGETLGEWLDGQQLTSREAAEMCAKIADALHHAHERGITHRDLKPANIIIDPDCEPHLMDFGLARRDAGEMTVTVDGQLMGTPGYMSPEQASGHAHLADRRSDVYSLGVVLYQLLTGEVPFRGSAARIVHQVIHDAPPRPRELNAHVSKDLETITLKCLEKEPSRRYQTAAEVASELRRVLAGEPIQARPCGTLDRVWRWYQRNPLAATWTAGGYGVIATLMVACWSALGLVLIALGAVDASPRVVTELIVLEVFLYPLMMLTGLATLQGRLAAIAVGTLFTYSWTLSNLAATFRIDLGVFQLHALAAPQNEPYFHFQLTTLLFLMSAIGAVLYTLALVAEIRRPAGEIAAGRRQPKRNPAS